MFAQPQPPPLIPPSTPQHTAAPMPGIVLPRSLTTNQVFNLGVALKNKIIQVLTLPTERYYEDILTELILPNHVLNLNPNIYPELGRKYVFFSRIDATAFDPRIYVRNLVGKFNNNILQFDGNPNMTVDLDEIWIIPFAKVVKILGRRGNKQYRRIDFAINTNHDLDELSHYLREDFVENSARALIPSDESDDDEEESKSAGGRRRKRTRKTKRARKTRRSRKTRRARRRKTHNRY